MDVNGRDSERVGADPVEAGTDDDAAGSGSPSDGTGLCEAGPGDSRRGDLRNAFERWAEGLIDGFR